MSKCVVCGEEITDAEYVLFIRRDGSEANACDGCNRLFAGLDSETERATSLKLLKKHAAGCGDFEVRRYLDGIMEYYDTPESFNKYIEGTRQRTDKNAASKSKCGVYRLMRPAALLLLVAVAIYGIMQAIMDFGAAEYAAGAVGLVLTAIIDGTLFIILAAVMDGVDDARTIKKHMK